MTSPRTGFAYLDAALDPPGSVLALAHRGGAYHPEIEGLENTLQAFGHAIKLGYDYLETDVHVTKDGVLLAFHDDVLDRVTDQTGAIGDHTLAEVRRALVNGTDPVPTLAELFEAFPTANFNIDAKADASVEPLARFIAEHNAWDRVCVASFSVRRLNRFRRLTHNRVVTSAGPAEILAFLLLPGPLATRLTRGRPKALQIPLKAGRWKIATPRLVHKAHRAGLHVHVWTIDDPDVMRELVDAGVDGLMTDRTDILRQLLIDSGHWRSRQ